MFHFLLEAFQHVYIFGVQLYQLHHLMKLYSNEMITFNLNT